MDMKICEHIWAEIEPGIYKNLKFFLKSNEWFNLFVKNASPSDKILVIGR